MNVMMTWMSAMKMLTAVTLLVAILVHADLVLVVMDSVAQVIASLGGTVMTDYCKP